ncbi:MAG: histone deacetylase family protein [Burkholderiales bacterium]|jgi:acetoin utilization deacetylase AcuC-like enzyme|nr:histone deacetylase family protein [Burkholderiales bacterium]
MATAFITHADCMKHDMGTYHPECPTRLSAIDDQLISSGIAPYLDRHDAPVVSDDHLARVHPRNYINAVRAAAPHDGIVHLDPDTAMSQGTLSAALRAAGAGVLAVDLVMEGKYENAFCSVRPPGHHATRNRAMGFCFFNNIAVAAAHALEGHGLERVAVIDWDVHHGNGTEDIFAGDDRVLMVSTFQHPFYPYSGADDPAHNMVNVPMPAGAGSQQFREVVEQIWLPALEKFQPQMIFISAGFDAHIEDDMAMMRLVDQDYGWTTQRLVEVAERHGSGRVVSMLEGGYALSALARSVVQHLRALGGF